jgi:chromosome segregation ATPase
MACQQALEQSRLEFHSVKQKHESISTNLDYLGEQLQRQEESLIECDLNIQQQDNKAAKVEAEKKKYAAARNFKQASASKATLDTIAKDIQDIENKKEILTNARDYIGQNI